jgi:phosphonatase-like hydrolase
MEIRLVVFDVGGTTVEDTGAVRGALHDAIASVGPDLKPAAIAGVLGMAKPMAIRMLLEGHGRDDLLPHVPRIHADFVRRMRDHFTSDPGVRPVPGVIEAIRILRSSGIQVALGTGFSRDVLDVILDRLQWGGAGAPIDATVASDEVPRGRPWPDMIDHLRERLGGIPEAAVAKVGDTPIDLQEGTMARCGLVIGVCSGAHSRDALAAHHSDALLDTAAEVPGIVLAHR